MQPRRILFLDSTSITVIAFLLLVTGSTILTRPVYAFSGTPYGTFITWFHSLHLKSLQFEGLINYTEIRAEVYKSGLAT